MKYKSLPENRPLISQCNSALDSPSNKETDFSIHRMVPLMIAILFMGQVSLGQGPGNALSFNGTDDYVLLSGNNGYQYNSNIKQLFEARGSFTIEAWVKRSSATSGYIVSQTTMMYLLIGADGRIVFDRGPSGTANLVGTESLVTGRWYHVAASFDGATQKIYVNGRLDASQSDGVFSNGDPNSPILLGGGYDYSNGTLLATGRFSGNLDEVRIWNTARSQADIQGQMFRETSTNGALLRYFKFNQSSGSTVSDGSIWAADAYTKKAFNLAGSESNWVTSYAMVVPQKPYVSNSTGSGFTANWTAPEAGTVDNYTIEVATDASFTSYASGYPQDLSGSVYSHAVSSLSRSQVYYWRVRAKKSDMPDEGGYSPLQTLGVFAVWTGASSTDWNTAGNWSPGVVPVEGSDVSIPDVANDPVLDQHRIYSGLSIASGATLSLGSFTLSVKGTFLNDGAISGSGMVSLSGLSPQSMSGSGTLSNLGINNATGVVLDQNRSFTGLTVTSGSLLSLGSYTLTLTGPLTNDGTVNGTGRISMSGSSLQSISGTGSLSNLQVNNSTGVSIASGRVELTGVLTPTLGILTTNNRLTLKSNLGGTAMVGSGSISGGYVSGLVTVERYIPTTLTRKWQLLTAPLTNGSANSIYEHWQNNGTASYTNGVEIWGNGAHGNPNANSSGIATEPTFGFSMRSYVSNAWTNVTNTKNGDFPLFNASGNNAYAVFVTGPFRNGQGNTNSNYSTATSLSATGNLIQGDFTRILGTLNAGQFALVGNPYASPIDPRSISAANSTNISNTLWMWDARQPGSNTLGRYVSFDVTGGVYSNGGPGTGYPDNGVMIQSGQAFFVKAVASASTSITFRESAKSTSQTTLVFGNNTQKQKEMLRTTLVRVVNRQTSNLDGAVAFFYDGANPAIDGIDGTKLMNSNDNLSMRRSGSNLVFEHRPRVTGSDTIFLRLTGLPDTVSSLMVEGTNFTDMWLEAKLVDNLTKKEMPLKLNGRNIYDFAVDANTPASSGDRFMVVLGRAEASAQLISIDADAKGLSAVDVKWSAPGDRFIKAYEVERSTDGVNYAAIGSVDAGLNNNGIYSLTDNSPEAGENNYRIRAIGINGGAIYSEIAMVALKSNGRNVTVYPNPVVNRMQVFVNADKAGPYTARIVDANGRSVWQRSGVASGTRTIDVNAATLKSGVYTLVLTDAGGRMSVTKFIKK